MATSRQQMNELTECMICTEVYSDPRMLPCAHSFCRRCLEQCFNDSRPVGMTMSCPLCRTEFQMPFGGVRQLPHNYTILQLLEICNKSMTTATASREANGVRCDICSADSDGVETMSTAQRRCLSCGENLCDTCAKRHLIQRVSRGHNLVPITSQEAIASMEMKEMKKDYSCTEAEGTAVVESTVNVRRKDSFCTKHPDKLLELHCDDCKVVICVLCLTEEHQSHNFVHVDKILDLWRKQMDDCIHQITGKVSYYWDEANKLETKRAQFFPLLDVLKVEIGSRSTQIKRMVDEYERELKEKIDFLSQNELEKFSQFAAYQGRKLRVLERIRADARCMIEQATPAGIPWLPASESYLSEMRSVEAHLESCDSLHFPNVSFLVSDMFPDEPDDSLNAIGQLLIQSSNLPDAIERNGGLYT